MAIDKDIELGALCRRGRGWRCRGIKQRLLPVRHLLDPHVRRDHYAVFADVSGNVNRRVEQVELRFYEQDEH